MFPGARGGTVYYWRIALRDAINASSCSSAARAEANLAYDAWCDAPGSTAYVVYRAAEDRADAAEHALVASADELLAV